MHYGTVFEWLEQSSVAVQIRQMPWLFPAIETIHIIGFVVLVGAAFLFDLRLLGIAKKIPVAAVADYILPWARRSLLFVVPSGLLLFISEAQTLSGSRVFGVKLLLIAIASFNAGIFHRFTFRTHLSWSTSDPPVAAKTAAIISIIVWSSVITCGRLIAYF